MIEDPFNVDDFALPVVGLELTTNDSANQSQLHTHKKGQLIVMLSGTLTTSAYDGLWLVPKAHGLWIPAEVPHYNILGTHSRAGLLFIEPANWLGDKVCVIAFNQLLGAMCEHFTSRMPQSLTEADSRLANVFLEQLQFAPRHREFHLALKSERLRPLLTVLSSEPAQFRTLSACASYVAMSERTLSRLIYKDTGMSFGQWRRQWSGLLALQALSKGEKVYAIAHWLGYESVSAFIEMFKSLFAKTPREFFTKHP